MPNEKFRPYLTAPELQLILSALKSQQPYPAGLVKYLETFAIKIERGVLTPSHTLQPSIEQKLGLIESEPTTTNIASLAANYNLFPDQRKHFTPRQLEAIQQHRYVNDMMSAEEEKDYVSSLSGTPGGQPRI